MVANADRLAFVMSFLDPETQGVVRDAIVAVGTKTHDEKMAIVMGFLSPRARSAVRYSSYMA